jgi:alkylation response protein AidB-like acyl-CoA dehydrogenase
MEILAKFPTEASHRFPECALQIGRMRDGNSYPQRLCRQLSEPVLADQLDVVIAALAMDWLTECGCRIVDECVHLHGGYGYKAEFPIARMCADSRVERIYVGTNEDIEEVIFWYE